MIAKVITLMPFNTSNSLSVSVDLLLKSIFKLSYIDKHLINISLNGFFFFYFFLLLLDVDELLSLFESVLSFITTPSLLLLDLLLSPLLETDDSRS